MKADVINGIYEVAEFDESPINILDQEFFYIVLQGLDLEDGTICSEIDGKILDKIKNEYGIMGK